MRSRSPSAPRAATSSSTSPMGAPRITKDGVTVAKEIELSDKFENMGAQMVREVASKTNDLGGRRHHHGDRAGRSPSSARKRLKLRRGRHEPDGPEARYRHRGHGGREGCRAARSKKVASSDEIAQVGTIASNGDKAIGDMIAEADEEVSATRASSRWKRPRPPIPNSTSSRACSSTAAISRPYFITNAEKMLCRAGRALCAHPSRRSSRRCKAMLPILEAVVQTSQAAADRRRGHRRRGFGHARGQQAARRPQGRGRQGTGLR